MPSMTAIRIFTVYISLATGPLSIMGSSSILVSIWFRREKLKDPQHRILGMMAIFDLISSINTTLRFLTFPSGLGIPTFGNQATCTLQGFFGQFNFATGTYNLVLSLYYYLTINRGMKQKDFARCLEKFFHAFVVCFHVGVAITGASIGLFNPSLSWCYIAPYPPGCAAEPETCERFGTTYPYLIEAFGQFWIQLAYVVIFSTNLAIWLYVRKQEKAMERYTINTRGYRRSMKKTKHARKVLAQSLLYVASFVLTWSWNTIYHLIIFTGGKPKLWPVVPASMFLPMQGFWNAFVYARPRYLRTKKKMGGRPTLLQAFRLVFLPPKPGTEIYRQKGNMDTPSPAHTSRPTENAQGVEEKVDGTLESMRDYDSAFFEDEEIDQDSIDYCPNELSGVST